MKDYSTSEEERKDFVLGFDVIDSDEIIVRFAKGESWIIPYSEENEQILIEKMRKQVDNSVQFERNKVGEKFGYMISTISCIILVILSLIILRDFNAYNVSLMSIFGTFSVISFVGYVRASLVLKDLRKNKIFIEMEKELNSNIRRNNNTLANVSNRTKRMIDTVPEDRPVFDINSFNYVRFEDLEQIMENVDRNKRFGFVYDESVSHEEDCSEKKRQSTGMTRKRKR